MSKLPNGLRAPTTVLVADDDDDMRSLIALTLRSEGYTVNEATDGAELLSKLEAAFDRPEARPDLVIADVMMPKLSGLGVLEALRTAHVHFPVLVITALSDMSIHIVARRLGALGVIRKPFPMDELRSAVFNACRAHDDELFCP